MPTWLTVEQASKHLQVSRTTLYRMIADGRVKAYEMPGSGRKRFKLEELDAILTPADSEETGEKE